MHRAETFGLDTAHPWALDAFRLVFNVPRAYSPLVDAWDDRFPRSRRAIDRLTELGFLAYQDEVILDTRTMEPCDRRGPSVWRFRTTHRGHLLRLAALRDANVLLSAFPQMEPANLSTVYALLDVLDLDRTHARFGLSASHACTLAGMQERLGRWWIDHLIAQGYVRRLERKLADVRAVVPAHWRVTRMLCRQLSDVLATFPATAPPGLAVAFRLSRSRFLGDIDPSRLGISGSTDYDHDVEAQGLLAMLLASPRMEQEGVFAVEPRIVLDAQVGHRPWPLLPGAVGKVPYQPDAEMRERDEEGVRRSIVEYERFQSRRDAWSHIERFLGWLHQMALPHERAVLRFVVDSPGRERSYVALIEAFVDYVLDFPERIPANPVTFEVTSMERLLSAEDALDPTAWYRLAVPRSDTELCRPVLHDPADSPYQEYFRRAEETSEEEME